MTDRAVELSITLKVYGEVIEYTREIGIAELETGISQVAQEMGMTVLMAGLKGLDDELRNAVPAGWQNVGTEERSILSSVGRIRYQRRIYKDEKGERRKPLDEILGVERYDRESQQASQPQRQSGTPSAQPQVAGGQSQRQSGGGRQASVQPSGMRSGGLSGYESGSSARAQSSRGSSSLSSSRGGGGGGGRRR